MSAEPLPPTVSVTPVPRMKKWPVVLGAVVLGVVVVAVLFAQIQAGVK
jgi:hypothetical protein